MKVFLIILLMSTSLYSQELKYVGELKQSGIAKIFGEGIESAKLDGHELNVHESKYFLIGFDRDDSTTMELKVKFQNGKEVTKKITPQKRKFRIQRINNMKPNLIEHPEAENERVMNERKISQEARAKIGDNKQPMYLSKFVRPVKGGRISGKFGNQRILNGEPKNFHNGVDIALPAGTPVFAMSDGKVLLVADTFYYAGNNILIDHGDGLNSFYLHLRKIFVKNGELIKAGQKIGEVGTTGRSTGPHLHWGVQWFKKRIDPLLVLEFFSKQTKPIKL